MMIVQIVAQILNNQSSLVVHLFVNFVIVFIASKFEKLLNIFKYEKDKDQLNA